MDITETTPLMYLTVGQFTDLMKNYAPPQETATSKKEILDEKIQMKEVCKLTGYSKDMIYRFVRELKIPHYRYTESGRLWFKRSEILVWLDEQKVKTLNEIYNERKNTKP